MCPFSIRNFGVQCEVEHDAYTLHLLLASDATSQFS
jgi:hypothetical protein